MHLQLACSPRIAATAALLWFVALPTTVHGQKLEYIAVVDSIRSGGQPLEARWADQATIGTFEIDTDSNLLRYEINPDLVDDEDLTVTIMGFAPSGWQGTPLLSITGDALPASGIWHFSEVQQKNLVAGLAYVDGRSTRNPDERFRAQIRPRIPIPNTFPARPGTVFTAGGCQGRVTIFGVVDDVIIDMDTAQVTLVRGAPADTDGDGRRDVAITVEVRVGGGFIPGVGRVDVEMFGEASPALVEALTPDADFPARMTFELRKRYTTAFGTFISETEVYLAPSISSFPPFGQKLYPTQSQVRLLDEKTGRHVGNLVPGTIVPLFYLDRSTYPLRTLPKLRSEEPYPRFFDELPDELKKALSDAADDMQIRSRKD